MKRCWLWLLMGAIAGFACADEGRYDFHDVRLGETYVMAVHRLDMRDIEQALAAAAGKGKPDLGAHGYGCMRREDAGAEVSCVTHDVHPHGLELREIRLSFIEGTLQFFSVTAELGQRDGLIARIQSRFGRPAQTAAEPGVLHWSSGTTNIRLHTGPSLTFASFESASYAAAVERRRRTLNGDMVR